MLEMTTAGLKKRKKECIIYIHKHVKLHASDWIRDTYSTDIKWHWVYTDQTVKHTIHRCSSEAVTEDGYWMPTVTHVYNYKCGRIAFSTLFSFASLAAVSFVILSSIIDDCSDRSAMTVLCSSVSDFCSFHKDVESVKRALAANVLVHFIL